MSFFLLLPHLPPAPSSAPHPAYPVHCTPCVPPAPHPNYPAFSAPLAPPAALR